MTGLWDNAPTRHQSALMRIHRDQPLIRLCGTLLGIGFVAIGAYAVVGSSGVADAVARDRAFWFGVTAVIGGILAVFASLFVDAVFASLFVEKLGDVWCRHPRRW